MGTHTYLLEVFRKNKDEPLPTINSLGFHRYSRISAGCFSDIVEEDFDGVIIDRRYMEEFSCRELLLDESGIWDDVFSNPSYNFMVGIRCYGEMYDTTSRLLMRNSKSKELVQNLIKEIFGITAEIKYGILSSEMCRRNFGHSKIMYDGGDKNISAYVTLYLNSWENLEIPATDCGVSAVLALLREPRIVQGILSGDINDTKSLCKELIKISVDRAGRLDNSYDCFTLAGMNSSSPFGKGQIMSRVKDELQGRFNDDGSDWMCIMLLAVFCYMFKDIRASVQTGEGGPANFAEQMSDSNTFKEFAEFLEEDSILRNLHSRIALGESEIDDDFDYDENSPLFIRTKSWANL